MKNKNIVDTSMKPLWLLFAIILISSILYISGQIALGNIRCNIGYKPGVQGRIIINQKNTETYKNISQSIEKNLIETQRTILTSNMKSVDVKKFLYFKYSKTNNLINCYYIENEDRALESRAATAWHATTNKYKKLYTNHIKLQCTPNNKYCSSLMQSVSDIKNDVQDELIKSFEMIALTGGGWHGCFWKRANNNIETIYTYVLPIYDKDILLTSSFIAN